MQAIEIKSLNKLAFLLGLPREYLEDLAERSPELYRPYNKPKQNNSGYRIIDNPAKELKVVQKRIEQRLLRSLVDDLPEYMHGGRRGKSVATNAIPHVGRSCLLSLDLSNCFGHVTYGMVYGFYSNCLSCTPPVARLLTRMTTVRNRLPQGGVTSPALCNLILEPLITKLVCQVHHNGLTLTNYVDDIFVSGDQETLLRTLPVLLTTIDASNFAINRRKISVTKQGNSMRVTGVVTNTTTSIGRKRIRNIERKILRLHPTELDCCSDKTKHKLNSLYGEVLYAYSVNKRQGDLLRKKLIRRLEPFNIKLPIAQ